MANIMINEVCNLQCPYCFANKYVNGDTSTEITFTNFKKAVDWINKSEGERIGIIGGEPTLHSRFLELLDYAVCERQEEQEILVFTNGLYILPYAEYFARNDIALLINLNSGEDIGENKYSKVVENIALLRKKGVKMSIGINFYKPDINIDFVLNVVKEFAFSELRVGITSPNTIEKIKEGPFSYYKAIKDPILDLIREMAELGCGVHFDCQKIPKCLLLDDIDELEILSEKVPTIDVLSHTSCSPVLDILPDLKVVRCFGVSDRNLAIPMESFEEEADAVSYFETNIDNIAKLIPAKEECSNCYYEKCGKCQGSCITYKMEEVKKLAGKLYNERNI